MVNAEFKNEVELLRGLLKSQPKTNIKTHHEVFNVTEKEFFKILAICQEKLTFCDSLFYEDVHGSKKSPVKSINMKGGYFRDAVIHFSYQKSCLPEKLNEELRERRFFIVSNEPIGVIKKDPGELSPVEEKNQQDYRSIYENLFIKGDTIRTLSSKNETTE